MDSDKSGEFITALLRPEAYAHPVSEIKLRETHISWILLTGDYAYKIKKPVDFGFLDFSTLAKRQFYCQEELRLNSRLAPQLYLGVVAITGPATAAKVGGDRPVLEYAVRMRQFDTRQTFDALIERNALTFAHMDETTQVLAGFHGGIAIADKNSPYGNPDAVRQPVQENIVQLRQQAGHLPSEFIDTVNIIGQWSEVAGRRLDAIFRQRKAGGFIRECHGDLHLGNIVVWQNNSGPKVTPFDGIEFNPALRWIDVINELAFLLMDLNHHAHPELARQLLNHYLELTGDYAGLCVLHYYQIYRAMVRAKVTALRLAQTTHSHHAENKTIVQEIGAYLRLAAKYTRIPQPKLIITHGLSGSGKTYVSQQLLQASDLIRLRSDVERKRLHGLDAQTCGASGRDLRINTGIYTPSASRHTYQRLAELTQILLNTGFSVLVDATFLRAEQRQSFRTLADNEGVPLRILHCEGSDTIQRQRIQTRAAQGHDASEADLTVYAQQQQRQELLSSEELAYTSAINTTQKPNLKDILLWLDRV
jgi:aminoglycoside phosphotransferase family enzyme/predicted kinase